MSATGPTPPPMSEKVARLVSMGRFPNTVCTYTVTGPTEIHQMAYECKTCKIDVCAACKATCHAGPNHEFDGSMCMTRQVCGCGARSCALSRDPAHQYVEAPPRDWPALLQKITVRHQEAAPASAQSSEGALPIVREADAAAAPHRLCYQWRTGQEQDEDTAATIVASKIGGRPYLPPQTSHPTCEASCTAPITFFCQIRLGDMPPAEYAAFALDPEVPQAESTELLQVFCCCNPECETYEAGDTKLVRIVNVTKSQREIDALLSEPPMTEVPSFQLRVNQGWTARADAPFSQDWPFKAMGLSDAEADAISQELYDVSNGACDDPKVADSLVTKAGWKLSGFPLWYSGDSPQFADFECAVDGCDAPHQFVCQVENGEEEFGHVWPGGDAKSANVFQCTKHKASLYLAVYM